jgi:SAM-dependent methyltransferase
MRLRLAHELLDEDHGSPAEIRRSLGDLWWINQHLGGLSSWHRLLGLWQAGSVAAPSAISLLDLGAGTGEMAAAIAAELRGRGLAVRVFALDRRLAHLRGAATSAPEGVVADALQLPFAEASIDLVACNLFLHHFHDTPGDPLATRLLREMARVARRAVLINDLERAWVPYAAIRLLSWRFSRITRHDGPRSVAQAYTPAEMRVLCQAALPAWRCQVSRLWPYRLGLVLSREGGEA